MKKIYLDYNATTPVAPEVAEAIQPFLTGFYGNPSSSHALGRAAKEAIEDARMCLAQLVGAEADEVVFTSGGTESNNLAIQGIMLRHTPANAHMIISAFEHPAVSKPAHFLERLGYQVSVVDCTPDGLVSLDSLAEAFRPNTRLVSIMLGNNEIGTLQPVQDIANMCQDRGVLFHTDASQCVGKVPVRLESINCDMITVAGHKFYGPKGIGALVVRDGLDLECMMLGGSQERARRGGTENTPYIAGLGVAAKLVHGHLDEVRVANESMRDYLQNALESAIPGLLVHGKSAPRLPNTLSCSFPGVTGHKILKRTPEVYASTGSACHSSGEVKSATLEAISCPPERMAGTVRLSCGWYSSMDEMERAANLLIDAWENLHNAG